MDIIEKVQKLLGWERTDTELGWYWKRNGVQWGAPTHGFRYRESYEAALELRNFVVTKFKCPQFVYALKLQLDEGQGMFISEFDLIDASPEKQFAAFCEVFKDELKRIK